MAETSLTTVLAVMGAVVGVGFLLLLIAAILYWRAKRAKEQEGPRQAYG